MIEKLKAMRDVLEEFRLKKIDFEAQREQIKVNYQQLEGAIFALDTMSAKYHEKVKELDQLINGESGNIL